MHTELFHARFTPVRRLKQSSVPRTSPWPTADCSHFLTLQGHGERCFALLTPQPIAYFLVHSRLPRNNAVQCF